MGYDMIFTECCYCEKLLIVGYNAGDPGAGGFSEETCEECGKTNIVQLVSMGGTTYSMEEFKEKFIDTGLVGPKHKESL